MKPQPFEEWFKTVDSPGDRLDYLACAYVWDARDEYVNHLEQIEQAAKALYKDRAYAWQNNHMWDDLRTALYGKDDPEELKDGS